MKFRLTVLIVFSLCLSNVFADFLFLGKYAA